MIKRNSPIVESLYYNYSRVHGNKNEYIFYVCVHTVENLIN